MSRVRALVCALLAIGPALACSGEDSDSSGRARPPQPSEPAKKRSPRRSARCRPSRAGRSTTSASTSRRCSASACSCYFFEPESAESAPVSDAVARIAKLRGEHNFEVVGVAVGSSRPKAKSFATDHGARLPRDRRRVAPDRAEARPALARGACSASTRRATWSGAWPVPRARSRRRSTPWNRSSAARCACPIARTAVPGDRPIAPQFTADGARSGREVRSRVDARQAGAAAVLPAHLPALPRGARRS